MATKTAEQKAAEKAAKEAKKASEKLVKELTALGVKDLTGQETVAELEARLKIETDAAEAAKAAAAAAAGANTPEAPKEEKKGKSVSSRKGTGRFEVSEAKGGKWEVFNDVGQLIGTFETDREAGEFARRSNAFIGK